MQKKIQRACWQGTHRNGIGEILVFLGQQRGAILDIGVNLICRGEHTRINLPAKASGRKENPHDFNWARNEQAHRLYR